HRFETVNVVGGAYVDFGEDRVIINDPSASTIGSNSTLRVGEVDQSTLDFGGGSSGGQLILTHVPALSNLDLSGLGTSQVVFEHAVVLDNLIMGAGSAVFNGGLTLASGLAVDGGSYITVNGTFELGGKLEVLSGSTLTASTLLAPGDVDVLGGSTLTTTNMTVSGSMLVDGSTLVGENIEVTGSMDLFNASQLTVKSATISPKRLYGLDIEVGGTFTIDVSSRIALNGKGYPANYYSGPDFSYNNGVGCHGGRWSKSNADCTHGRYERARFAGSAGQYHNSDYPGHGGGQLEITAGTLWLEGRIEADGLAGKNLYGGGAGGGIHVEASSLQGSGSFSATGAGYANRQDYAGGGGGRISLYVDDRSGFSGSYTARGRAGNSTGYTGGSGTVYIMESSQSDGHLYVTNEGYVAQTGSTPIRNVGRHEITAAQALSPGVWQLTVGDSPWKATSAAYDWGIDGIEVDLEASETLSSHYVIESNTTNTIEVLTNDNLAG
ncbi:MAG: hypothetical protein GY703_08395, partial [Gammaproteobacteria bacterium]|nr:hypothetical protein [Gammaproteobacteria bacterium]